MPIPISAGLIGGLSSGLFSSTFGNLLTPARRGIMQDINQLGPNELPDIGSIINAYNRGLMSDEMLSWASAIHGVSLPNAIRPEFNGHASLWNSVALTHLQYPSGVDAMRAFQFGMIDEAMWRKLMNRSGSDVKTHQLLKNYYYNWLDTSNLYIARNRGIINDVQFNNGLKLLGLAHDELPAIYNTLRNGTLSPGEMTFLAGKQWLDADAIATQSLLQEMPKDLEILYAAAGLDTVDKSLPASQLGIQGLSWAQLAWVNHWSTLGVGTVLEMLHRFRQNRVNRWNADGLAVQPFGLQNAKDWIARNNIPPQMRDAVIAAGFRPLDRRVLMIGAQTGEIDRPEAIEILLDSGLSTNDAERFADILDARVEYQNNAPIRALEHGAVRAAFEANVNSYKVGVIDRNKFTDNLSSIGLTPNASDAYADAIDANLLVNRVNSVLKALKRDYLNGTMNPVELGALLSQSGIAVERVQQYLTEWGALRTLERRTAQTEKILSWYVQGILTRDVTYSRLSNLGWTDVDALAYIAEASLKIARRDAAIEQAGFRNAKANAALLDRLKRQAEQQAAKFQTELRRLTPVGRLIKWLRQGSISAEYFENRLRSMDYPTDLIAEYLLEAQKDGPLPATSKRKSVSSGQAGSVAGVGEIPPATGPATGPSEQQTPRAGTEPIR